MAPLLTSGLLVLSAFFVASAISATGWIKVTLWLIALFILIGILITLLSACCAIVLRIASRRMLASAFACTLFHSLISFSIVCHY